MDKTYWKPKLWSSICHYISFFSSLCVPFCLQFICQIFIFSTPYNFSNQTLWRQKEKISHLLYKTFGYLYSLFMLCNWSLIVSSHYFRRTSHEHYIWLYLWNREWYMNIHSTYICINKNAILQLFPNNKACCHGKMKKTSHSKQII